MRFPFTAAAVAGVACAAWPAFADTPANDIKNGTQLFAAEAHVTIDGNTFDGYATEWAGKPTGTLTFDIPASVFGFATTAWSLHAVGTPTADGSIVFTTANTYSPPVSIDEIGETMSSETGTFTMRMTPIAAAVDPDCALAKCVGSTIWEISGGAIVATGSFGTKVVALDHARGAGGVARAPLYALSMPPLHINANGAAELPLCSNATAATHTQLRLTLATPAPIGGAQLSISTTAPGVRISSGIVVPSGRDVATVDAAIPAGFSGPLAISASGGGQTRTGTVTIGVQAQCTMPPRRYVLEALAPGAVTSGFGSLNDEGDRIVAVGGTARLVHAGTLASLATLVGATSAGAVALGNAGQVTGRLTKNGVTQAYRADLLHGSHAPLLLGDWQPEDLSGGGTVVGYRTNPLNGLHVPVVDRGTGTVDLALSSSYGVKEARALFIAADGTIVGTFTGTDNIIRGYKYKNGTTTTLPSFSGHPAIPAAVAADGTIAVNATSGSTVTAARINPNNSVQYYATPSGYASFTVTGINKWGTAIGFATCTTCSSLVERAFVSIPGGGTSALAGLATGLSSVDQALAVNDDNQVVLHGVASGVTGYYLLSL